MTKQTVEVPDFPEGWNAIAYRCPESGEYYLENNGIVIKHTGCKQKFPWIIVEKIQPRRIVLEETEENNPIFPPTSNVTYGSQSFMNGSLVLRDQPKIWKEVKE